MSEYFPLSLRHEYELYVEHELETYKDSIPRCALLSIGDQAVNALSSQSQLELTELVLCEEVDRIIRRRLNVPSFKSWRRKRLRKLAQYRRPEHWGLQPNAPLVRAADRVADRAADRGAEARVLVAGAPAVETALFLAANGCDVTALDREPDLVERVLDAATRAGLASRVHGLVTDLGRWAPPSPLDAVVCGSYALTGLSMGERARVIDVLQDATAFGGVHVLETSASSGAIVSLDELASRYGGWDLSIEPNRDSASTIFARKGMA
ncbi:MAG TPA: hypothetical protein VKA84_29330 [Gemmatimonadaceae bacterium]|nr:hypothetical protein [Gemmatimonadaceae bacterium]